MRLAPQGPGMPVPPTRAGGRSPHPQGDGPSLSPQGAGGLSPPARGPGSRAPHRKGMADTLIARKGGPAWHTCGRTRIGRDAEGHMAL